LALPSTSFVGRGRAVSDELVDPKAKPWDDATIRALVCMYPAVNS
jgi:hypothetical protein